jgi:hypothetical protein
MSTWRAILRQADLTVDEFISFLQSLYKIFDSALYRAAIFFPTNNPTAVVFLCVPHRCRIDGHNVAPFPPSDFRPIPVFAG